MKWWKLKEENIMRKDHEKKQMKKRKKYEVKGKWREIQGKNKVKTITKNWENKYERKITKDKMKGYIK